jgi:hypothetical protein
MGKISKKKKEKKSSLLSCAQPITPWHFQNPGEYIPGFITIYIVMPARFTILQNMTFFYSFDLQPLQKNVDDEKCKTTLMQVSLATKI